MQESGARVYEFEGFRLNVDSPGLWRGGELVQMPPKELEILILLVTSGGEIVSREKLLESVWKDTFVEEGNINYTTLHLESGRKEILSHTLKFYETFLKTHGFLRVHRGYLINPEYVKEFCYDEYTVTMTNGHQANISRRKVHNLEKFVKLNFSQGL